MEQPDASAVRAELERILASELFANAGRLSRFLRFTVEKTLEGEGDQLKEYRLGTEVFDRDASYDPRLDSIVRVEARRLRSRLAEYYESAGASDPIYIRYLRGGYSPRFELRGAAGTTTQEVGTPSPELRIGETAPERRRHATWPVVAAGSLVVVLAGILLVLRSAPGGDAAHATTPQIRLAVLPLAHFSSDAADDALADRLTDGLITELARYQTFGVISRTSVMQFKGTRRPLPEVAHGLGAGLVLEGSVIREDGAVLVKTRLVDPASDTKVWADVFNGESGDLVSLQQRIARRAAAAVDEWVRRPAADPVRSGR
jgi:TolB-like protein